MPDRDFWAICIVGFVSLALGVFVAVPLMAVPLMFWLAWQACRRKQ